MPRPVPSSWEACPTLRSPMPSHPVVLASVVGSCIHAARTEQAGQLVGILLEGAVHNAAAHAGQGTRGRKQAADAVAGGLAGAACRQGRGQPPARSSFIDVWLQPQGSWQS